MSEMQFEIARDAIRELLVTTLAGQCRVIGGQNQAQAAEEIEDADRSVEVYYSRGEFPKNKGSLPGPCGHECTFQIDIQASKAATADLATISSDESSPAEIIAALAALTEAKELADESVDECWRLVWQTLMNAEQTEFGLDEGTIASRWVEDFQKGPVNRYGDVVVATGRGMLTFKVSEDTSGVTPVAGEEYNLDLEVTHDEEEMDDAPAGVYTDNAA